MPFVRKLPETGSEGLFGPNNQLPDRASVVLPCSRRQLLAHEVRGFPRYAMLPQVRRRPAYDEMKRSDLADDHGPVRHLAGTDAHIVGVGDHVADRVVQVQLDFDLRIAAAELREER